MVNVCQPRILCPKASWCAIPNIIARVCLLAESVHEPVIEGSNLIQPESPSQVLAEKFPRPAEEEAEEEAQFFATIHLSQYLRCPILVGDAVDQVAVLFALVCVADQAAFQALFVKRSARQGIEAKDYHFVEVK